MRQRSRIFLLLVINVLVLGGLALLLAPDTRQLIAFAVVAVLMVVLPGLIVDRSLNSKESELETIRGELKATREELAKIRDKPYSQLILDELTGLFNEAYFRDAVTQHRGMAERGSYRFSLAVLQVDQFVEVVDKYGLGSGSEVLELFSGIVKAALREVDVAARLGKDTFGLLFSGASEEDALVAIKRIGGLVSQIQVSQDENMRVTSSGGMTSFHGTETPDDLLVNAGKALEFAIEQGRDRIAGFLYQPPIPAD